MSSIYSPQTLSYSHEGRSEISAGDIHSPSPYAFSNLPLGSELGRHTIHESPAFRSTSVKKTNTKLMSIYRSASWILGFKDKYSLLSFIVFGGALLGFCLARSVMLNTRIMREETPPGDFRWFDLKTYKVPYFMHIYATIVGGFIVGLQFIPAIRRRCITIHRFNGYLSMILLIPGNIAGSIVARHSFGGELSQQIGYYLLGIMIVVSMLIGYSNVKKDTRKHRKWMLRSVVYFGIPILPRPMVLIGSQIITEMGDYWTVWRCDEVFYVLQSADALSQLFPQCVNGITDLSNNALSVAVHASNHEGDLGKSSAVRLLHGMCLWLSMIISVIAVEIYIRKTEGANYSRHGFVLEPRDYDPEKELSPHDRI